MKGKTTKTLRHAYAYKHMRTHAQALHAQASCMHTQTRAWLHMLGFQILWKTSFSALKIVLERIPHCLGAIPNPYFLTIKSYTWYLFKRDKKSEGKTQDSLEIVNHRGSFSQDILKSIFFLLRPFLVLIFEFQGLTNLF